jgi:hypothetical protein
MAEGALAKVSWSHDPGGLPIGPWRTHAARFRGMDFSDDLGRHAKTVGCRGFNQDDI